LGSDFVRTGPAGLKLAVLALEDVPVRSRVAHRADPLNQRRFRLQKIEGMVAVSWKSHFGKVVWYGKAEVTGMERCGTDETDEKSRS